MINICINKGLIDSNVYIVGDNGEVAVIDCGVDAEKIYEVANTNGLKIKYIILTHCHFDHVFYTDALKELTGAKVIIYKKDAANLQNSNSEFMKRMGLSMHVSKPDILVDDGDEIVIGDSDFKFIHTPGHTSGSMCIMVDNLLFSGDTLFERSMGRTDLGDGNDKDIHESLRKLCKLPDETKVFPGHGQSTTIAYEKALNPYLEKGDFIWFILLFKDMHSDMISKSF